MNPVNIAATASAAASAPFSDASSIRARPRSVIADLYRAGGTIERACYVLAAVMVTSGVVHLALAAVIGAPWSGPVSLRKAVTFGVSFGVLLALLTAVTRSTRSGPLLRRWLLGALALASVGEVLAATVLGWRRVTAQTVTAAPLDVALGRSGAVTGAVLVLALVGCAALSTRPGPARPGWPGTP